MCIRVIINKRSLVPPSNCPNKERKKDKNWMCICVKINKHSFEPFCLDLVLECSSHSVSDIFSFFLSFFGNFNGGTGFTFGFL